MVLPKVCSNPDVYVQLLILTVVHRNRASGFILSFWWVARRALFWSTLMSFFVVQMNQAILTGKTWQSMVAYLPPSPLSLVGGHDTTIVFCSWVSIFM
jgi:hypothetical protein